MHLSGRLRKLVRSSGAWKGVMIAVLSALVCIVAYANAHTQKVSPGTLPFTPTRIGWLTTTLQASLRTENLRTDGFQLEITSPDPETILIYVRYMPNVNREIMNMNIDGARKVIQITAKSYGWDKWVKIREDVQPANLNDSR
jgi:hypothetical protein